MYYALSQEAGKLGFIAMGCSSPGRPVHMDAFHRFIAEGRYGDMGWLARHMDIREDPSRLLKGCQSIISLAYPYSRQRPATPEGFNTARYTEPWKEDYHARLRCLGRNLAQLIRGFFPDSKTRICVDSAPILERDFAMASGIGFTGKNNMLIIPGYGSYFTLVEILTTVPIQGETGPAAMESQCGTCDACIQACPTGALEGPYRLNAARCLSYLSIEYRGVIDRDTGKKMGTCFFGCDRCQEACPHNQGGSGPKVVLPSVSEWLSMKEDQFNDRFGKSSLARAGLPKIQSNLRFLI
jgi:epoxyqueuosine reductase